MTFILPILAVCIGFMISLVLKPGLNMGLKMMLSFSGAFLLSITVFEFLPYLYEGNLGPRDVGIYIIGGLLLQLILEFFSRGAEHGHMHLESSIQTIPWVLLISLSIHSLLEGFPLTDNNDLLYGVTIHKIPIAIILSSFLLASNIGRARVFIFLIIFAMMTPLGSYLAMMNFWTEVWKVRLNAIVVGALLHISTTILFESSKNHRFNTFKFVSIVLGIVLAFIL